MKYWKYLSAEVFVYVYETKFQTTFFITWKDFKPPTYENKRTTYAITLVRRTTFMLMGATTVLKSHVNQLSPALVFFY